MPLEKALLILGMMAMATILFEILYVYATRGFGFGFAANRPPVERTAFGKRVSNIYQNQVEAVTYMGSVLAAALFMGVDSDAVQFAALVMVIGRAGFILTYFTGVHFVRVPFFVMGAVSTAFIAISAIIEGGAGAI